MRLAAAQSAVGTTAATIMLAVPARADVDTDFANQLHTYGIYGQRDYNAWLAKITCERLDDRLDSNAEKSAVFLSPNLPHGSTIEQTWQFLAAAINTYCPDRTAVLTSVAAPRSAPHAGEHGIIITDDKENPR
jgi:hypothetical protein